MRHIRLERDNIRHVVTEQVDGPIWMTKCKIKVVFGHVKVWAKDTPFTDCKDCNQ